MEKEVRNYEIELRQDSDKNIVEGYALLFNTPSRDMGGFIEEIAPEALDGVLDKSDVLAVLNHNENKGVFARSRYGKGSLHLEVDDKGLRYWWKVGKSALHQELSEMIERGDIFSSSFAFTVSENGSEWDNRTKPIKRTITKFSELFDVSPVYRPAYESTTVGRRCLDMVEKFQKEEQELLEEEKRKVEEQERIENEKKLQEQLEQEKIDKAAKHQEYIKSLDERIQKLIK